MRVKVHGVCESAKVLRTYLRKDGTIAVTDEFGDYNVYLEQDDRLETVMVDGIDCDLERKMIANIEKLGVDSFILARKDGIRSDRAIKLSFPSKYKVQVEKGAFRGLHQELATSTYKVPDPPELRPPTKRERAVKIIRSLAFPVVITTLLLIMIARNGHTSELPLYFTKSLPIHPFFQTTFPIIRVVGQANETVRVGDVANSAIRVNVVAGGGAGGTSSTFGVAFPGTGTAAGLKSSAAAPTYAEGDMSPFSSDLGGALRITCMSGCGGASPFADAAAFTFGTTSIGNIGAVVDDTATNTVAENSAGTPRMNTNRILYTNLRNNAGTEITTWPVTGTFWQATQPVSGTFWQATQPVSGTVAVSNAFLLDATLTARINTLGQKTAANSTPVVLASDAGVTVGDGAGAFNTIVDSGTITANQGTPAAAANRWPMQVTDGTDLALVSGSGALNVTCDNCGAPASFADDDPFTFGTTGIQNVGFVFDDVATNAVTENSAAAARITTNRAVHVNLRNNTGTEIAPLTDTQLRASAVPVSGTVTITDGAGVINTIVDSSALPTGAATAALQLPDSHNVTVDNAAGASAVNIQDGGNSITVDGTFWQATQPVSGTVTANVGTFPDNEPFNVAQINGVTPLMGNGASGTGALRVAQVNDGTGVLAGVTTVTTLTNLTNLPNEGQQTAANSISVTPDTDNDAIGAPAAAVPGEAIQVGGTDGTNLIVPYIDPCEREARTVYRVDIVTATTTEIAAAVASEFYWICSINLLTAGANNVVIVEDDTATNCPSPTAGVSSGGVTAAEGYNFAANGGAVIGTGQKWIMKTGTANRSLCIITSAAVQLAGTITYVSAP